MNETRLFINTNGDFSEVDLYDNISIPLNYSVAEVEDISKKDTNFSLTIKIPNTRNNARLFEIIEDISVYGSTFEMLKQYPCYVEVGCNRTFEGYFQLTKVIVEDDREIYYEGNLFSNVVEFISRLGTSTLRGNSDPSEDLSFSNYTMYLDENQFLSRTNLIDWDSNTPPQPTGTKPFGKGCYFAVIDKFNLYHSPFATDTVNGYRYLPIYYDQLTPFLFYKEIWDKIFEKAGFSYVSDFIRNTNRNTTPFEFDRLVYPFTGYTLPPMKEVHSITTNIDNSTDVDRVGTQWDETSVLNTQPAQVFENLSAQLGVDENPAGTTIFPYQFTAPVNGVYNVNINVPFEFGFDGFDLALQFYLTGNEEVRLNDGGTLYDENTIGFSCKLECVLTRGGAETIVASETISGLYKDKFTNSAPYSRLTGGRFILGDGTLERNMNLQLLAGDTITFRAAPNLSEAYNNLAFPILAYMPGGSNVWRACFQQFTFTVKNKQNTGNDYVGIRLVSDFTIGGTFNPTVILNPKRKKVDFVTDIIRKFNLYVEDVSDKKDENGVYYRDYPNVRPGEPVLLIEPREMYYRNKNVVRDWTGKTDVSSVEFERIDNYIYKQLIFKDKNDKTFPVSDYNGHNYTEGEYGEEIVVSPFNTKEDEKTEILTDYGQTMCGVINHGESDFLEAPYLFTLNDGGGVVENKEYNDRILFLTRLCSEADNGVSGIMFFPNLFDGVYFKLFYRDNSENATPYTLTNGDHFSSYNYLDHFNAPFGRDTADLNYGWANWYYQNLRGTWATNNNIYNVFYKEMVDGYNAPEARLMRCKMYLKSSDIRDLKLSDTIIVNNAAFHINRLKQWKDENTPVEVELIKINVSDSNYGQPIIKGETRRRPTQPPKYLHPPKEQDPEQIEGLEKTIESNRNEIKNLFATIAKLEERIKKLEG